MRQSLLSSLVKHGLPLNLDVLPPGRSLPKERKRSDGLPKDGSPWTNRGDLVRKHRKDRTKRLRREKAARRIQRGRARSGDKAAAR